MSEAFARFRAAITADRKAAATLAAVVDPAAFEYAAIAWATARGIALAPQGLRDRAAPIETPGLPPKDWLPVAIDAAGVRWLHFAGAAIAGAFFDDDCRRAAARPFNRIFAWRTPLATLAQAKSRDPDGLVFHLSRCGSTLVAQMLGAAEGYVAIAEPAPIDAMVTTPGLAEADRVAALRGLASRYAGDAERCFLKLDAWHIRALPLFRATFPDTPWIFLHRDPVEVIISHLRMRGRHTVPGLVPPAALGMPAGESGVQVADHIARVLGRIAEGALAHWTLGGGIAIDYRELPDAMFDRVLPHFGISPSPIERVAMGAAAHRDAKSGGQFETDGSTKRAEADATVTAAAALHLASAIEAIRRL
jgi:hypothetical protein